MNSQAFIGAQATFLWNKKSSVKFFSETDSRINELSKSIFPLENNYEYLFLATKKAYGKNGPHKEGEGGRASGGTILGGIIIIGGAFTSLVNPAAGLKMMQYGAGLIVTNESIKLIEEHGKK